MSRVAIVGAGVSGLSAAWELSRRGWEVVVFEKSRGLSGRAATRSRGPVRYDHGANFFRTSDPEVHQLIHDVLPTSELAEIPGEVWTFDEAGTISPGDPDQNAEPKYTYRSGISTLGKLLAAAAGVDVQRRQEVTGLHLADGMWTLATTADQSHGPFDEVILTAPAPQSARLIAAGTLDPQLQGTLVEALEGAPYRPQFSFVLGYHRQLGRPQAFHALVNTDGGHPLAWLSFEEDKPGHVPEGESALVVQMAPHWSAARLDKPRELLLAEVTPHVASLLPGSFRIPDWWDSQRWMLAHPAHRADGDALRSGESLGLFFAGDALAGRGRVPLAIKSGLATARRLAARSSGKRVVTCRNPSAA